MRSKTPVALATVALLAFCAFAPSGALAANFTASSYPATVTGEQVENHVWTFQGQKVECTKVHMEGALAAPSESISLTPTYAGCTAFGIMNASIQMNSCYYEKRIGQETTTPTTFWHGSLHLRCTKAGDTATVRAPTESPLCTVHIPPQTPTTNKYDFENKFGGGFRIRSTSAAWHGDITDIGGFLCPLSNNSTDTTGTYSGAIDIQSTEGKTIDIG